MKFELKLFKGTEYTYEVAEERERALPTGGIVPDKPSGVVIHGDRILAGPSPASGVIMNDPEKIATSQEAALQILNRRNAAIPATGIVIVWTHDYSDKARGENGDGDGKRLPDVAYNYIRVE